MNVDILEGKWKQVKGHLRAWWGDLTDDEVEEVAGRRERLIGLLQERYGYNLDRAEQEVNQRLQHFETEYGGLAD